MKYLPNRRENGMFASKIYKSRARQREERNGKIVAGVIVASVCLIFALGVWHVALYTISAAKSFWGHTVEQQRALYAEATEIAWRDVPDTPFSQPMPFIRYVPEIVPKAIAGEFADYSEQYGVPPEKMARIMKAESNFNPKAKNVNRRGLGTDHGICQVNDVFWKKELSKKGIPFASLESCFYIFSQVGEKAWLASERNWR